jgi:hypothetical protein
MTVRTPMIQNLTFMKTSKMTIELGLYQHYKGGLYEVIGIGKHSESLEELVVYRTYDQGQLGDFWVRPISMWSEEVKPGVLRFKKVVDVQK